MKGLRFLPAPVRLPIGRAAMSIALLLAVWPTPGANAAQLVIGGPGGSGAFGEAVTVLPNGNIVVVDSAADAPGPIADVGAVYLYRPTGVLIRTLRGTTAGDRVGSGGVTVLSNGNYVVRSPVWDNGAVVNAGAVTFGSGVNGIAGVVTAANSLVGSTAFNIVGSTGVVALSNGNYVVLSSNWDNGAAANAGAATFGSGVSGIAGVITAANSLVGSTAFDFVGAGVTALSNGNYVVRSPNLRNGAAANAGAATFGSGVSGIAGVITAANSLVGSTAGDSVGADVTALSNGNYVVRSPSWDNGAVAGAGAATFGSGVSGIAGVITAANSLVGSTAGDNVGNSVTALSNGNYVVLSSEWDNGAVTNAGAVTFGSGVSGIAGVITAANSLVGSTPSDGVGNSGVTALSNGNYVVPSTRWDGAVVDAGAATFGFGVSGIAGVITAVNSLVGSTASDFVGGSVTALSNGNYVVSSPNWNNGALVRAGGVTFGSGVNGIAGVITVANSLVGSTANDNVGSRRVTALGNGNYVVLSELWDNGAVANAGAATFGSGVSGIAGVITAANSLVGSTAFDFGGNSVTALSNGNYVVRSPNWNNGTVVDAGAVTFGSGVSGIVGVITAANSLVGSTASDFVGGSVTALSNGNYVVRSPNWNNGTVVGAGAITLALANGSVTGPITNTHSVLGLVASQGSSQVFDYDPLRNQLAVGQPASNRIVLQRTGVATSVSIVGDTPDPSSDNQPVTFTATVSAATAPNNGQVDFRASSGESCVDTTPTATSATSANFSCTIVFTAAGTSDVIAEYIGSVQHAYSGSAAEPHTAVLLNIFANGFETP